MTSLVEARGISMDVPGRPRARRRRLRRRRRRGPRAHRRERRGQVDAGPDPLGRDRRDATTARSASTARRGAWRRPREAIEAGIAVIPQELQLVSSLSAAENIFLGRDPRTPLGLIDVGELHRRARRSSRPSARRTSRPAQTIERLEAGQRQLVAIARALSLDARLIIMDEPTTSLSAPEAARLERLVERLCERGVAIVYISHKLDEVRAARRPDHGAARRQAHRRRARRRASTRPRWCA